MYVNVFLSFTCAFMDICQHITFKKNTHLKITCMSACWPCAKVVVTAGGHCVFTEQTEKRTWSLRSSHLQHISPPLIKIYTVLQRMSRSHLRAHSNRKPACVVRLSC